jgi:signal transduction histidine kinase/CheY-like chemotaxis protein
MSLTRKAYYLIIGLVLIVCAINIYYFVDIFKNQINFQRELLIRQVQICGSEIEQTGLDFENEINYILFSDDISGLFSDPAKREQGTKKLENFYSKYQNLVTNIRIFDTKNNVLSLYKNSKGDFGVDYYSSHRQKQLATHDKVEYSANSFQFYLPVFKDNQVFGNIEVTCDFISYMNHIFNNYHAGNTLWQYIIDENGKLLLQNLSEKAVSLTNLNMINDSLAEGTEGWIRQEVTVGQDKLALLTVYYPVHFLRHDFGIAFALQTHVIKKLIINKAIIIGTLNLGILVLTLIVFMFVLNRKKESELQLQESESDLKKIIEFLPIGILIIDKRRLIRIMNKTAAKILNIPSSEDLVGKKLDDSLEWTDNILRPDIFDKAFDSEHFITSIHEGQEMVILKKEIPVFMGREELFIEAFIDVTPIEKARKLEAAANNAKSEFLAKMSHEIRTPMNGIIGMADALTQYPLPGEQAEQLNIIRKSADLLLSILNDILDFSKIEAGKMVLEEIPFRLTEELEIAVELFQPYALDKKIELVTKIAPNVSGNLIGDPFRLRQVLTNLIGNAVKFTPSGKVVVGVEQLEEYAGNITLRFTIEDTGIGIPADKIKGIFGSFSQVDGSTTRKYGGSGLGTTISKQLVELMNGEISVASPSGISTDPKYPGTRFTFTVEAFSNQRLQKHYDFNGIGTYSRIRALLINDRNETDTALLEMLTNLGIKVSSKPYSRNMVVDINDLQDTKQDYHIIMISDNPYFDGFKIAAKIQEAGLSDRYLMVIVSSNNIAGNYVRCRKLGVDYYVIQPHDSSEIFDIIQDNFPFIRRETETPSAIIQIRRNISILLAEDNLINQKVAQTIFKNLGFEISIAKNGVEVLKMVAEKDYDIIFMDLMMPEMDGLQATIELRARGYKVPIIAMTAGALKESKEKALAIGMNDYVVKPVVVNLIKSILMRYFSETKL